MKRVRIVILAKAPGSGRAKTRLIPSLGISGTVALAQRLLDHAVSEAIRANVGVVELLTVS